MFCCRWETILGEADDGPVPAAKSECNAISVVIIFFLKPDLGEADASNTNQKVTVFISIRPGLVSDAFMLLVYLCWLGLVGTFFQDMHSEISPARLAMFGCMHQL